ncbi:MAG: hypothetical protein HYX59_01350 [Elusimicrobia bacterium]|nr:hypothetical protein [Elusimicrobiota bacterium]
MQMRLRLPFTISLAVWGMLGVGLMANADEPLPAVAQDKGVLLDRLILAGLEDPALTFEGANVLLNSGFFDKPLRDAAFGRKTCDELDPATTSDDYRTDRIKSAGDYARRIARQDASHTTELPESEDYPRQAAASFARLLEEIRDSGGLNAIDGILSSPGLVLFLLDPEEAGYCRRVAAGSVEDRLSQSHELKRTGVRRLERLETSESATITLYLYRPRRLVDSIQRASRDPSPPGADELRGRLADYAARMTPLERFVRANVGTRDQHSSPKAKSRTENVLDDPRNRLPSELKYELQMNMPIEMVALRREITGGKRRPSFSEDQWRALELLTTSCAKLSKAQDFFVLRIVTDPATTDGRYISRLGDDRLVGVSIQLALLNRVAHLDLKKSRPQRRELDFLCSAVAAVK